MGIRHRRLGRTELKISEIGLGAVEIGLDYGISAPGAFNRPPEAEAILLLQQAIDVGINLIDTARGYGKSEELIGRALAHRRDEYYLATKCKCLDSQGQLLQGKALHNAIREQLHRSLKMLKTDCVDFFLIHWATPEMIKKGEAAECMQLAVDQGKARYLGVSGYLEEAHMLALDDERFDVIEVPYNLLDRHMAEHVFPKALARDVGIIVRSALLKGALTDQAAYLPERLKPLAEATEQLRRKLVREDIVSLPQAALRFVLSHPAVASVLVGMRTTEELMESVIVSDGRGISEEDLAWVEKVQIEDVRLLDPSAWGLP
jgi:aryl-alcohol dehydrogenase-like predicted oxidoreductase